LELASVGYKRFLKLPDKGEWIDRHGDTVFALSMYIVMTIAFTWPLAANFATFVNGSVMDVFHELWYLNLDYHSAYGPFFLLYTNLILFPYGVPLYFQVVSPLHAIVGAPFYYLFGLIPAYNFIYMFTFFVSAITMYVFVKYLTGNKYAAFFAGIAFGFAPVHTAQGLAHINIMASEMMPVFGYFLVKMVREKQKRDGFYAGIALALNAMLDLHFLLFCGIILVVFLIYYALLQRKKILNKGFAEKFILMTVTAGLIGLVVYYQTFYGLVFASKALGTVSSATVAVHQHRSPDLLQFFVPPSSNPIFGRYTFNFYSNVLSFYSVQTYLGYTVLAASIVGVIANRKKRDVVFWAILAIIAFALSLGPQVEYNGQVTSLQGPWAYLYYTIPLFNSFRTPYRIDYIVAFSLAILGGYGIAAIMDSFDRRGAAMVSAGRKGLSGFWKYMKFVVVAVLMISLVVEFFPAPYPEMNASIPSFYTQVLANDHSNFTVLEVPAYSGNDVYLYYQTAYMQPVVNGHVSRTPQSSLVFLESAPFVDQLGTYIRGKTVVPTDIVNQTLSTLQIAPYILAQYNIKYVIIHTDLMPPALSKKAISLVSAVLGVPYYEDSSLVVFRFIPPSPDFGLADYPAQNNATFVALLNGGWNQYGQVGHHARTMESSAGIDLYMRSAQDMQVRFKVEGITGNHLLQVAVNGNPVGIFPIVNGTYKLYTTPFIPMEQGYNDVTFTSLDGCSAANYGAASSAVVCVSVQFSSVAFVPITLIPSPAGPVND
jgi:hypothetical protein